MTAYPLPADPGGMARGYARTTRDENEPEIIAALRRAGAVVFQLDNPVDLLVGLRGRTYLIEVKAPGAATGSNHLSAADVAPGGPFAGMDRRLTKVQAEFIKVWPGSPVAIVETREQALLAIGYCTECGQDVLATDHLCTECEMDRRYGRARGSRGSAGSGNREPAAGPF